MEDQERSLHCDCCVCPAAVTSRFHLPWFSTHSKTDFYFLLFFHGFVLDMKICCRLNINVKHWPEVTHHKHPADEEETVCGREIQLWFILYFQNKSRKIFFNYWKIRMDTMNEFILEALKKINEFQTAVVWKVYGGEQFPEDSNPIIIQRLSLCLGPYQFLTTQTPGTQQTFKWKSLWVVTCDGAVWESDPRAADGVSLFNMDDLRQPGFLLHTQTPGPGSSTGTWIIIIFQPEEHRHVHTNRLT